MAKLIKGSSKGAFFGAGQSGSTAGGAGTSVSGNTITASLETEIDIKHRHSKLPLLVDEKVNNVVGASSAHVSATSSVEMQVSGAGDYVIRQTFERFNYQSGKPKVGYFTFIGIGPGVADVSTKAGFAVGSFIAPYPVENGCYLGYDSLGVYCGVSYNGIEEKFYKQSWDDPLDGSGKSKVNANWATAKILRIEYLWLGFGPISFSLLIDGQIINFFTYEQSNALTRPHMESPNLPIRYEIRSTGGAAVFKQQCFTVGTLGGNSLLGVERGVDATSAFEGITLASTANNYLAYAVKLNPANLDAQIKILSYAMFTATKDDFVYSLILNPTVSGALTYVNQSDSSIQVATGTGAETITGGTVLASGPGIQQQAVRTGINNVIRLGHDIEGNGTVVALAMRPLSNGASGYAYFNWLENV